MSTWRYDGSVLQVWDSAAEGRRRIRAYAIRSELDRLDKEIADAQFRLHTAVGRRCELQGILAGLEESDD